MEKEIETSLKYCIDYLKEINEIHAQKFEMDDFTLLRALMNITLPCKLSDEFYENQDKVLTYLKNNKTIIDVTKLDELNYKICLFQGDITTLKADAIVNACNEKLLGCFAPLHYCIDNAIHSFAGLQLRNAMNEMMELQGHDEFNGQCKVSKGYNLPATYVFHTVGPRVYGSPDKKNKNDLKSCYISCLEKASEMKLHNIVFCCISTGVFGYPKKEACMLAVTTVKEYLESNDSSIKKVIFNVFGKEDYDIYYQQIKGTN